MARITRSRQDPAIKSETKITRSRATVNTITEKNTKEKGSNAKASTKKALIQDENAVPTRKGKNNNVKTNVKKGLIQDENAVPTMKGKSSNAKSSIKKAIIQDKNIGSTANKNKTNMKSHSKTSVLGSKLQPTRKNNSSGRRSSLLALKSPVLRDRTNTSNDPIRSDTYAKKDVQLNENKKITKTNTIKKSSKKNNIKNKDNLQVSIKKYVVKEPVREENSTKNKEIVSNLNENENKQEQVCPVNSQESSAKKSRKKNNLSKEEVEELLNQEDKISETENKEINKNKSGEENVPMDIDDAKAIEKEDKKITKKFFKHKIDVKNIAVNLINRKNPKRLAVSRKKINTAKKIDNKDKTFSPNIKEQRKSTKPAVKKLRTRAAKNYCEVSKVSEDVESDKKQANEKTLATESDKKGVPVYKTIECSQENKDNKEIYEFPDDSQEDGQKVKKQKRIVRKPIVKRARKAVAFPATTDKKTTKKPPEKVPNKVQFKEQEKQPTVPPKQGIKTNGYTNIEIPEDLQNAGDSTIAEASTIKILSNKKLEGNEKINLMVTPSAPKTINSELKLFGPTNAITSQPKIQYSNMVNHSLIRHSMSPIRKEIDNFDIGSPWRPIDAFSRVQKIVQSTPQINRVLASREKKPLIQMNFNKKSLCSEDTIHLSSIANEKSNTQKSTEDESQAQKGNVSPRKFGTVISNLNSMETTNTSDVKQVSQQGNIQSPQKAILPQKSFENHSDVQDNIPSFSSTLNKDDNKTLSPIKSPKKKIQTPSPFRFDRMRSSKRIAAVGSKSNSENSNSQKENKDPNQVVEPSDAEKSKPVILRQSNLNNFLNLDEMPESSRICTPHGIFDDIHSTPINGKKPQKTIEEPNIENAFGFDDDDFTEEISDIRESSGPIIATASDVAKSVKGKLFPNARVKSKRISESTAKKTLLQNVLKKSVPESKAPENKENPEKTDEDKKNDKSLKDLENNNKPSDPKKVILESVSFSDTFDVLSENGEDLSSKIPDEIPLFVDLEPVHFTKPPRRSYNKRKKAVCFNTSRDDSENDEDDDFEKPKKKRKKESRLSREEQKRLQEWVKNTNESFKEIDHFDLVVE